MSNNLVSVIVPVYNTPQDKLEGCVASLLRQTHRETEILLIDDGSGEKTAAHLDAIALRDARIRVIHQKNGGVSAARNRGMDEAGGEYMVFVDADDCVCGTWLQEAVRLAQVHHADVVYSRVIMCREKPEQERDASACRHAVIAEDELFRVQMALLLSENDLLEGVPDLDLGPCAKLFRRSSVGSVRFPVGVKISEDQVFNHAVLAHCSTCVVTDIQAYYYIENLASVSHSHHPDALEVIMRAMGMVRAYLMDHPGMEQAFYHRVICDALNAIQFAYFCGGKHRLSMAGRIAGVMQARRHPLLREALWGVDLRGRYAKGWKLKVCLLRYAPALFVAMKTAYALKRRRA